MASSEVMPLARYWCPPAIVPGTDQGPGEPLACFATTYTFSAELLETELLPRFLGLEFDPVEREPAFLVEREEALARVIAAAVFVDQCKVDIRQTTLRWDQIAVRVPGGIQHAKVTMLAWERLVRVIVGSANLSVPGYRHNREVIGSLEFFDDAQSVSRDVLSDVLVFLESVLELAAVGDQATRRVRSGIEAIRLRTRKWSMMPSAFRSREYPQVHFVPNLPTASGGVARSVLKQVKHLWGSRRAEDIRVVTPFVGDPGAKHERLVRELAHLPHSRSANIALAVPGLRSETGTSKRLTMIPRRFWDAWVEAWKLDRADANVYVVTPDADHRGRPVQRPLHAKAIFISDYRTSLLCCGSSNFSAGGMGIGRANMEANLCYVDEAISELDNGALEDRLPVDWERDRAQRVEWPNAPELPEEDGESTASRIPPVFRWATCDPQTAVLSVALDISQALPPVWCFRLQQSGTPVLTSNHECPSMPADGQLRLELPPEARAIPITAVRVMWQYGDKAEEGLLPVHVEDRTALPPPEALRAITAEGILACILAGCTPAEWMDRQQVGMIRTKSLQSLDPAIDPHRVHDPSGLALYRVRRLGRALAAMGQRLVATVRTPEAMEYQVHQHPLGPVRLAEALMRESTEALVSGTKIAQARLLFSLLEITLMLAHAGSSVHRRRMAGEADLRPCFRRAVSKLLEDIERFSQPTAVDGDNSTGTTGSLQRYRESIEQQAYGLLAGLRQQGALPCR